ncbi:MAG: Flp pilus assembly pilin Flp, partial [Methylophagaceae bacterium]
MTSTRLKQLGQGMTEYIIIVALIAIVAITVFNIFGDTVRGQVGDMAAELGGGTA